LNEIANKAAYYARIAQYASDGFSQVYLGAKDVAPTTDNNGNPLIVGALYFNTTTGFLYVWDGTSWDVTTFNETTPFLSTGSTTERTLANRFADVVNVKDFGAVGNGIANDTTAATAAFNAANGNPVYFVDGDFNLGLSGYTLNSGDGAISFTDGAQKNVWLHTRKLTGTQAIGQGALIGFSPSAYMWDTLEDCDAGSSFFVASRFRQRFGGSSVYGGRIGLYSSIEQSAATNSSNTNRNYVALQGSAYCNTGDNGTDTGANAKGAFFGGGFATYVEGTAQNLLNVTAAEFNTFVKSGASAKFQFGLQIASANAQRGVGYDAAISISGLADAITHAGYGVGILFNSANGAEPFSSTSTIIAAVTNSSATVQEGIDFSSYTITNNILKGKYSRLSETRLTLGDSSGFAVIQGGSQSTNANLILRSKGTGSVQLQDETGTVTMIRSDSTGGSVTQQIRPNTDGTKNLGDPSFRWDVVYAATGTINTSDDREKTFFSIESAEKLAALEIKSNLRKFKFNSAIEEKGDNARIHFGASAQQVGDIMKSHGLDPNKYGFYCYDEWDEIQEQKDNEGNVIEPYRASGNRYGVRYEELLSFIVSAL
jgi:hypothetical protein